MAEMEIEANSALHFELERITEAGAKLAPLYGPGYTGMINLGNRWVQRHYFRSGEQANALHGPQKIERDRQSTKRSLSTIYIMKKQYNRETETDRKRK